MGLTFTHPFPSCSHICSGILSAGGAQRPCREKTAFTESLSPSPLATLGPLFILSKLGKNLVLILTWFKLLDPQPEVLLAAGKKSIQTLCSELGKTTEESRALPLRNFQSVCQTWNNPSACFPKLHCRVMPSLSFDV